MAGALKKTTNLTGLAVLRDPHKTLIHLYEKTIRILQKMPEDAAYRRQTSVLTQERLDIVKADQTVDGVEKKINCGQIEEVVLQAQRELSLARKMAQWQPWQPLVEEAPKNQWKWPIA